MKRIVRIILISLLILATSCVRESLPRMTRVENGEPVMLTIGFGSLERPSVEVKTKTEVSRADETTVHDLYVFLFDGSSGEKLYGRYFSYENRESNSTDFSNSDKECWFVENKTMAGITPVVENTRGAVKLSTVSNENCTLVALANVSNTLTSMNGQDVLECLNGIETMAQLRSVKVELQKNTVERKNLFLMLGMKTGMDSGTMEWNNPEDYAEATRVMLEPIDAKVKFRIKKNDSNIERLTPKYWQVCRVPGSCYLFGDANGGKDPSDASYFDTAQVYFEDTEIDDNGVEYQVFCFYMLENRQVPKQDVSNYYMREKQVKEDDTEYPGYKKNGLWENANDNSTYVRFDMVLTLTTEGIDALGQSVGHALTTDAVFTVHLGNFTSSASTSSSSLNDYNTLRSHSYTYDITINNSKSIYTEVMSDGRDQEDQPGQEGFLLLTNDEIINCDAHYEYHSMTFRYNPDIDPEKYSWFIKTPFSEGGPEAILDNGIYRYPPQGDIDYAWVKFCINPKENGRYTILRSSYPGEKNNQYMPEWKVGDSDTPPELMDVSQLVSFIVDQNRRKAAGNTNLFDEDNVIVMTAFIDEYYYEKHPFTEETDPDLWREFVNAKPRELHILSDATTSLDRQSDVIESSHSIIQESIQTIYNIYNPELRSIWGTEHKDEMKEKNPDGWPWGTPAASGSNYDNGRENTAKMWGVNNGTPSWSTFLNFKVDDDTPELQEDYRKMAYSCMTRNRDNNGDGIIQANEVRWYLASINQLIGTWIGNEALSSSARPYQPVYDASDPTWWHAHIVSSTYSGGTPLVLTAEEGISYYKYTEYTWVPGWTTEDIANKHRSVRCVRNVGTYDGENGVEDISSAPISQLPDQYYTRTDNADGTYSIHFSRMSPKALRDYSAIDFAKHFETSPNNRVYLEIIAQNPSDTKIPDGNPDREPYGVLEDMGQIIEHIDSEGKNLYCPEGYRLPNQRELAIMSLALPSSYWSSSLNYLPSCTLYSRGKYGTNDELYGGKRKLGWVKSTSKIHLPVEGEKSTYFRCVKDKDLTGTILGQLNVKDKLLCGGDHTTFDFKFSSTESVLTSAVLKLCYTDRNGVSRQRDIPVDKTPTSLQYNVTQSYHVPSLAELEIETLPCDMTIKLALRNAAGKLENFETSFTLVGSHLKDVNIDFPSDLSVEKGLPVQVNASSISKSAELSSLKLYWRPKNEVSYREVDLGVTTHSSLYNVTKTCYIKDLLGDDVFADKSFVGTEYEYYAVVNSSDGTSMTSPVRSMQILRYDYTPNPVPDGGWTLENKGQCSTKWEDRIDNLDFSAGDFIEADMDLSNCVYVYLKGTEADDMGKDNIFGFSTDNIASITNSIIWYYPSVKNLVAPPGDTGWTKMRIHAGRWSALELTGVVSEMNLILDKNGIIRDGTRFTGNPGDWDSRVKNALTSSSTVYVGSKEGVHLSRATYRYVRVIRNNQD